MRNWLPAMAVRHPVTVLMTFLATLVLGALAYARIPLQMMPSGFSAPYIWVQVPWINATPSEIDTQLVDPVEGQLSTVPGIKTLSSDARAGSASFSMEFHQSVDLDEAYNSVADRLERVLPELPEGVDQYGIFRFNPSDEPVLWAGVTFSKDVEDKYRLLNEKVLPRLERVPGVARIDVWGIDEKQVFIDFDREALAAYKLDLGAVVAALGADNFQLASGRIEDAGQVRFVRSLARYEAIADLAARPVAPNVTLDDVAEINYRVEREASINRVNGDDAVALGISKESNANTVEVCREVLKVVEEMKADPSFEGFDFFAFFNQGELIQGSVDTLLESAGYGGLFAVIVLIVFLRELKVTTLIATAIPLSLLMTVTVLYFIGDSLNLLSLMGLMIATGMVVDNSIVVVETIYRRRQLGEGRDVAAIEGTGEVNLAIVLSTATTMVVFLPIILMSEDAMFSFFMGSLGFPIVFALAASLVVALIFTPVATAVLQGGAITADPPWVGWMSAWHQRGMRWVLTRRFDSALLVLAVIFLTVVLPFQKVGCTDQAKGGMNDFSIRYDLPNTFSFSDKVATVDAIEAVLEENREAWGLRVYRSRVSAGSIRGSTYVYLLEDFEEMTAEEVQEAAIAKMPDLPGVQIYSGYGSQGEESTNTLNLSITGQDSDTLLRLSEEVVRRLRLTPGVKGAEVPLEEEGSDELRLSVDRDVAARYGLDAQSIGRTLAFAMRGTSLPPLHLGAKEVSVYARFSADDRDSVETLRDFSVASPLTGEAVPLRALTDVVPARGFRSIHREDRQTSVPVSVELPEDMRLDEGFALVEAATADMEFPRGYGIDKGDRWMEQMESDSARNMALLLSVVFVFLLMGFLFESLLLPMAILTTIPMALIGVYWTLYLTGTPLDVMGGVGLVVLIGVVVNNGIVLIDLVTQLRAEGLSREDALLQAGERRLRPVLMTALTTIVGLMPMCIGSDTFIGIPYAPLGRVIAGGMAASTVLTLFFVPYCYTLLDDLRETATRVLRYATQGRPASETP
ncbi:MAG: efflux RND transporter permease subunit [Deltaproteobacteria bacterium]|nr:efflux RND transporter permease subunit [Deltaproteobacteria bacterium]